MISEVKSSTATSATASTQSATSQTQPSKASAVSPVEAVQSADTVALGTSQSTFVTYSKSSTRKNAADVAALKADAEQRYASLRALVEQVLTNQTTSSKKASAIQSSDQDAVEQAQQAISEDGEFGVKAVSDRIVQFAIAVSGGDTAKYEELRAAIDKGFQQAAKSLGGDLPDISKQTYSEVMRKLDEWKDKVDQEAS